MAVARGSPDCTPLRQVRYTAMPSGMLCREMEIIAIMPEKAMASVHPHESSKAGFVSSGKGHRAKG